MKLAIAAPKLDVVLTNDQGEIISEFHAENYSASFDTEAGIKAANEIAEQLKKLLES